MKGTHRKAIAYKVMILVCAIVLSPWFAISANADTSESPINTQDSLTPDGDSHNSANEIGPQIVACGDPGTHTGYGTYGGTLVWNEHVDGDDCVLELVSGTIPDHGTGGNDWTNAPWYRNRYSVTKVVVDDNPADPVTLAPNGSYGLFSGMSNLRSADVRNLDTHNATDLHWIFTGCVKLTELDVTPNGNKWNTGNVTNMQDLFSVCTSLKSIIGIEQWDTGRLTTTLSMFQQDWSLESLDISGNGWTTRQVTDMRSMLEGCPKLRKIKINQNTINLHQAFTSWVSNSFLPTPTYTDTTGTQKIIGATSSTITTTTPTWLYAGPNVRYDAGGGTLGTTCQTGGVYGQPICTDVTKPGYRLTGWNTEANGTGTAYPLTSTVPFVPFTTQINGNIWRGIRYVRVTGDGVLYPMWEKTTPIISKIIPKIDGSMEIKGTTPRSTMLGDTFTTTPYTAQTGGISGTSSVNGIPDSVPAAPWTGSWTSSTNPFTNLPGRTINADRSVSLWLTSKLNNGVSQGVESERARFTVDTVAPAAPELYLAGRTPSSGMGVELTIQGTIRAYDSASAPTEAGDKITVTWHDGTTTTVISGTNGSFTVDVPAGTLLDGSQNATVTIWDQADGDGADGHHPAGYNNTANQSQTYNVRLLLPTVDNLPETGGPGQRTWAAILGTIAALALATGTPFRYHARRKHSIR